MAELRAAQPEDVSAIAAIDPGSLGRLGDIRALVWERASLVAMERRDRGLPCRQGIPARVVMEILGHSQIALTMNTYSHVAPEVSREAAERMAQALWQEADDDQAGGHGDGE